MNNASSTNRRLSKAERREQLLNTAMVIVSEQGTDALTLGYLAEQAGVSKPITYEHFGTRSGLLMALYQRIDQQQVETIRLSCEQTTPSLKAIAGVIAKAHMNCHLSNMQEWHLISAALKGDAEMEKFQHDIFESFAAFYAEMFAPYVKLPTVELNLRCIAIIGAGDALSTVILHGHVSEDTAVEMLSSLITDWLSIAEFKN